MNRIIVNADLGTDIISRHIYGHFAEHLGRCIYGGFWVGENSSIPNVRGIRSDVVEALRAIRIPVLRWPGGCFADEYHWMDGIGPREERPAMVNTHWGGVTENNHFGTHEFLDLCEQLGCEPYICGNVGSGTVREMQQWVEYITCEAQGPMADLRRANGREEPWRLQFWGVGNENWGCGGRMRPEYYADLYRRYATYLRDFGSNRLFRVACGASGEDYRWTEVLMREVGSLPGRPGRAFPFMAGLSLHYYTVAGSWDQKGSATEFDEAGWFEILKQALRMDELIRQHATIMDAYDPEGRIGLIVDEWGTWHGVEPGTNPGFLYQQNSLRDALAACLTLHIFNRNCARVWMANIAQTVNVLQAMVLTREEAMLTTPTYHVFEMLKVHQDATQLPLELDCGPYECGGRSVLGLSASASRDSEGRVHLSLCNLDPDEAADVTCELRGVQLSSVTGRLLTAETITAHNTFERPDAVRPVPFDGATLDGTTLTLHLPSKSIVILELSPGKGGS
jgi:alpha-N-arabinofuranosidase